MKYISLVLFLLAAGCSKQPVRTMVSAGPPTGGVTRNAELAHRTTIDHPDALGVSGSCQMDGALWLVTERSYRLLHVPADGPIESIPIEGVPEGIDLEGLACKN